MSIIRSLLAQRGLDFVPGRSAAELHVLEVLREASLPAPVQQYVVRVEYYGLDVHSLPSAVAYDSRRLSLLTSNGWTPLVFTDASSDRGDPREDVSADWAPGGHAHVP